MVRDLKGKEKEGLLPVRREGAFCFMVGEYRERIKRRRETCGGIRSWEGGFCACRSR